MCYEKCSPGKEKIHYKHKFLNVNVKYSVFTKTNLVYFLELIRSAEETLQKKNTLTYISSDNIMPE